jgi:hypothetical protein
MNEVDRLDVSARPERIWRCVRCGQLSGQTGHYGAKCTEPRVVEYVPASQLRGAVGALQALRPLVNGGGDTATRLRGARSIVNGALDRFAAGNQGRAA